MDLQFWGSVLLVWPFWTAVKQRWAYARDPSKALTRRERRCAYARVLLICCSAVGIIYVFMVTQLHRISECGLHGCSAAELFGQYQKEVVFFSLALAAVVIDVKLAPADEPEPEPADYDLD